MITALEIIGLVIGGSLALGIFAAILLVILGLVAAIFG